MEAIRDEIHWRHTREIISIIYNSNVSKKGQSKKGKDLVPLSIDRRMRDQIKPLTPAEFKKLVESKGMKLPTKD